MERFLSPVAVVRVLYFEEKIGNNESNLLIPTTTFLNPSLYSPETLSLLEWPSPYLLARIQLRVIGSLWRQLRDFSKWRHQPTIESSLWRQRAAWKGWRWIRSSVSFVGKGCVYRILLMEFQWWTMDGTFRNTERKRRDLFISLSLSLFESKVINCYFNLT